MRRRIRSSAALPLHRHSLPQLAVDGVLVAVAYFLAYRLRFDDLFPARYEELFEATLLPAVGIALVVFTGFRLYQKWWRYSSLRDLEAVVAAVVVTPVERPSAEGNVGLNIPTGIPLRYDLDENLKPIKRGGEYLDPEAAKAAAEAVANQGR